MSQSYTKREILEERWGWTISFLVTIDLFVHELLLFMRKQESNKIPTMAVSPYDGGILLEYNLDFADTLTDPQLRYVIKHEIMHVALHHCTLRAPEDPKNSQRHNIAADLAVNTLIQEQKGLFEMPVDKNGKRLGILPEDYGFPKGLSMEEYFNLLQDKALPDLLSPGNLLDDHTKWSEEDKEYIDQLIADKIEEITKMEEAWGKVSDNAKAMILAAQESTIPWHRYLRFELGSMIQMGKERTLKRPSRRFGLPFRGIKRSYVDPILIAWDLSGSISNVDETRFLAECNTVAEIAPFHLVMFDCVLQSPIIPFEGRRLQIEGSGGGGTNFQPVFDIAAERGYHSLIIFTDGEADPPTRSPIIKDVLWVLTDPRKKPPVDWGRRVYITPKNTSQPS